MDNVKNIVMKKFLILLLAFPIISCTDLLVEDPPSVYSENVVFSSLENADQALLGIYQSFYNDGSGRTPWSTMIPVDGWGISSTDVMHYANQQSSFSRNTVLPTDQNNRRYWNNCYRIINNANFFINRVNEIEGTDEEKAPLLGEARFLRGYAYMDLVQFWGGVPLRTEPTTDIFTQSAAARATEEEVWAQVFEDLSFAADNMSESAVSLGRADKWVARGFLAKAYLTAAGYPVGNYTNAVAGIENADLFRLAAENAAEVIQSSGRSLVTVGDEADAFIDYGLQFIPRGENSSESLWEIQFEDGTNGGAWGYRNFVGFRRSTSSEVNGQSFTWWGFFGGYNVGSEFAVSFHDDDIRWQWDMAPYFVNPNGRAIRDVFVSYNGGYGRLKFRKEEQSSGGFSDPINAPILRLSDMYLVYAEAANEFAGNPNTAVGGSLTAYEAINAIRNRAKVPELNDAYLNAGSPYGDTDLLYNMSLESFSANVSDGRHVYYEGSLKERFRDAVLMERAWELCWERHRWFDLKRHNKLIDFNRNQVTLRGGALNNLVDPIDKSDFATVPVIGELLPISANIQDHQIYMPIPQAEIQLNSLIGAEDQNPGY